MQDKSNTQIQVLTANLVKTLVEANKAWSRIALQAADLLKHFRSVAKSITDNANYFNQLLESTADARKRFQQQLRLAYYTVLNVYERLPSQMRTSLKLLGESGWYLDPDLPFSALWKITELLQNGRADEVSNVLVEYYSSIVEDVERELCEKHPHRASVLHSAFAAHNRGEFNLSIPVFLAQADGICTEKIGIQLYRKTNSGIPATSIYVSKLMDPFRAAVLHPLAVPLPISSSQKGISQNLGALNRHEIMHGQFIEYGTLVNSCRAISLLRYVSVFLEPVVDSKANDSEV